MFTTETKVLMPPSPAESELAQQPLRFTYASGDRPLDGYQIKRGVGRGGFGEVYFAVSDAGKQVALKLIRRNLDVELRGVTHCLNLKHQNLVALYDIRSDAQDDRWVVMEYVAGDSLEEAIARHPEGMPLEEALHWFAGIAAGVAYLHDHGIVHRDLKPANIFMDARVVKIGDYGLSKFISCSRRSGQTESVGTVHYMAPEIANGRYGKEIDTYALGIMLYEMLTGQVPFEGESVGEVLMKHLTAEPDLSRLQEPYRSLVGAALAKDPDARLESVAEMLARLPQAGATGNPRITHPTPANPRPVGAGSAGVGSGSAATAAPRPLASEEPIWASLRSGWCSLETRFRQSDWHPLAKACFGLAGVWLLVSGVGIWLPGLVTLGVSYLIYLAIRALFVEHHEPADEVSHAKSTVAEAAVVPPTTSRSPSVKQAKRSYAKRHQSHWYQQLQRERLALSWRARVTELVGSMLVAALVCGLLALVGAMVVSQTYNPGLTLWMAIVATLGCWGVMLPAKLTEGRVEDHAPLRFSLLVVGAVVGLVAFGVAESLDLVLPVSSSMAISPQDALSGQWFLGDKTPPGGRNPVVAAGYFACLLGAIRWWKYADYTRTHRLGFWSTAITAASAFFLSFLWWFPQPVGALLAGMIAFATQLASPWLPPSQRRALAEQEG